MRKAVIDPITIGAAIIIGLIGLGTSYFEAQSNNAIARQMAFEVNASKPCVVETNHKKIIFTDKGW